MTCNKRRLSVAICLLNGLCRTGHEVYHHVAYAATTSVNNVHLNQFSIDLERGLHTAKPI